MLVAQPWRFNASECQSGMEARESSGRLVPRALYAGKRSRVAFRLGPGRCGCWRGDGQPDDDVASASAVDQMLSDVVAA
ncbi:hypothetical protein [Micromonospora sp. U21]|uniref:hypothetical protein n=1 Tax=Micromonospora sp. U21 TaxID=2824899 RepID=UPI001B38DD3C|nr:hypothetical protein [Micromonospora sp. U21]MBQ0904394.1 hypothetical protein [Micromonospora sp. U21]